MNKRSIKVPLFGGGEFIMDFDDVELVAGRRCSLSEQGYVKCEGEYLHRKIVGVGPRIRVDHRNLIRTDNRRNNLRIATNAENMWNRNKTAANTSGFKGVTYCKDTGRWRAAIRHNNTIERLGRFVEAEDAAKAYDRAAIRLHGEFARLNFNRDNYQ